MKRAERDVLGEMGEVRVLEQWLQGRPWKKWIECKMGGYELVGSGGACGEDHKKWKAVIDHLTAS